jgi:choice-of-anchor C domain-containing protein
LAVSALIVTPVQAANLIQNGSFETATVNPGSFLQLDAVSTAITGWTVSQGSIDYIGTFWQASNGSRSLDLSGANAGGIQQTFNTTVGKTYRVTFDLAGNPNTSPTIKQMRISAAGSSANFSFDITGKSTTNMGWLSKSWDFTANSTTTTLEFISLTNSFDGPALDNVSVIALSPPPTPTPIPEPSSVLGLLSLGVLGISSALKRQS